MKTAIALVIFAMCIAPSLSWWENGHMLVAQIAKLDLLQNHPEVYPLAEDMALFIANETFGLSTSFIESAVWADDIKNTGWQFWDNWHFYDRPVNPDGLFTSPEESENSPWAINQTIGVLNDSSTPGNITFEKSTMLRMMMHIIGDMHQPLHSAELYSELFLTGDEGGNLINVTWQGQPLVLHAFWDSIAETLQTPDRPLNESMLQFFETFGLQLMADSPRSVFAEDLAISDVEQWTEKVYDQAITYAYDLLPADLALTAEYQASTYAICKQNIALAGYRLSDMIYLVLSPQLAPPQTVDTEEIVASI